MADQSPKYVVYLTDDARSSKELAFVRAFSLIEWWFECTEVEETGYFLRMKVINPDVRSKTFDLWLPVRFVLFIASAEVKSKIGFGSSKNET